MEIVTADERRTGVADILARLRVEVDDIVGLIGRPPRPEAAPVGPDHPSGVAEEEVSETVIGGGPA